MTLPSSKTIGDTGHVSDHNAITAHIAAHEANVTDAHDIDGLIAAAVEAHRADTTDIHGIANTAPYVANETEWSTWTPTISGSLSLGNATTVFRYKQIGKIVHFYFEIYCGSTTTGQMNAFTLPVTAKSSRNCFYGWSYDSGAAAYYNLVGICNNSTSTVALAGPADTFSPNTSYPKGSTTGAADLIQIQGTYEAA